MILIPNHVLLHHYNIHTLKKDFPFIFTIMFNLAKGIKLVILVGNITGAYNSERPCNLFYIYVSVAKQIFNLY